MRFLTCLVVFLLAGSALAQTPKRSAPAGAPPAPPPTPPAILTPWDITRWWPAVLAPGDFEQIVTLDLTADGGEDVCLVKDGEAHTGDFSEVRNAFTAIGPFTGVRDVAVLESLGGDLIASVSASDGLQISGYAHATGWVHTDMDPSPWDAATQLDAVIAPNGSYVLGALDPDGVTVRTGTWSPGSTSIAPSWNRGMTAPVLQIALLRFDTDAVPDIAVLQQDGLVVWDTLGNLLAVHRTTQTNRGRFAVCPDGAGDMIAWVTPADASSWLLRLVTLTGGVLEDVALVLPHIPANFDFTGISAGDVTGDGSCELLISQDSNSYVALLVHDGAFPDPYPIDQRYVVSLPGAVGNNRAVAQLVEMNRVGGADILAARNGSGSDSIEIRTGLVDAIAAAQGQHQLGSGGDYPKIHPGSSIPAENTGLDWDPMTGRWWLTLKLDIPDQNVWGFGIQRVEVMTWHQHTPAGQEQPIGLDDAERTLNYAVATTGHHTLHVPFREQTSAVLDDDLTYHLHVRLHGGNEAEVSPSYWFGVATGGNSVPEILDYLLTISTGPTGDFEFRVLEGGVRLVGAILTRRLDPPHLPGNVPEPGPMQTGTIETGW